ARWVPTALITPISSPSSRPCLSAVSESTMIWSGPLGALPEVISMVRASLEFHEPTMVGPPLVGDRSSRSASTTVTEVENTVPSATRTPSALRTSSRTDAGITGRSEEHTSELQSRENFVCRLLLEKIKYINNQNNNVK